MCRAWTSRSCKLPARRKALNALNVLGIWLILFHERTPKGRCWMDRVNKCQEWFKRILARNQISNKFKGLGSDDEATEFNVGKFWGQHFAHANHFLLFFLHFVLWIAFATVYQLSEVSAETIQLSNSHNQLRVLLFKPSIPCEQATRASVPSCDQTLSCMWVCATGSQIKAHKIPKQTLRDKNMHFLRQRNPTKHTTKHDVRNHKNP